MEAMAVMTDLVAEQDFCELMPAYYRNPENGICTCNICGGPFKTNDPSCPWITRAVLLTDKSIDFRTTTLEELPLSLLSQDRAIIRLPTRPLADAFFRLTEGEHESRAVSANDPEADFHAELYIQCHEACVQLVDRFVDVRYIAPPPMAGPWTLSKIWDVLRLRLEAEKTDARRQGPTGGHIMPVEPHGYHLADMPQDTQWCDWMVIHDPLDVGDDTATLLSNAKVLPQTQIGDLPNEAVAGLRRRFEGLPQELQDLIIEHMLPFISVSLTCNRLLTPQTWQRILSDHVASLFPFLWDFDTSELQRLPLYVDYELLIQKLARPEAFNLVDYGGLMPNLSLGLRNRRRIWRILETMRAGDMGLDPKYPISIFRENQDDDQR